jgi:probable HAF family extracellular repeat protein
MSKIIAVALLTAAPFLGVTYSIAAPPPSFTVESLDSLPGKKECFPTGISAHTVVGYCDDPTTTSLAYGVAWTAGQVIKLKTGGEPNSGAFGVNSRGAIVGVAPTLPPAPVTWPSSAQDVARLAGVGKALAINASGAIVGQSVINGHTHAVLWSGGSTKDLLAIGGSDISEARGINDAGVIVGVSQTNSGNPNSLHAAIWQPNQSPIALPQLAPATVAFSTANAINKAGTVVGISQDSHGQIYAVSWIHGSVSQLPDLAGLGGGALAINSAGHIVGSANNGKKAVAALWIDGSVWDLNTLIKDSDPLKPYVYLTEARGISDSDQIAVLGWDMRYNAQHPQFQSAYLLTRVRTPGTPPQSAKHP